MTLSDLDRVIEALEGIWFNLEEDPDDPVWSDKVRSAREALTLLRQMREGAVEAHAWRFAGAWHASEYYGGATGDIEVSPALLITPEESP